MKYIKLFSIFLFLTSCASIPRQAPELSEALGNQINSFEKSHLNLLHSYFNERKIKVDEFIETTWLPEYAANFFNDTQVQEAWNEIVASDDKKERLDFIIAVGPELQAVINEKRQELITPLNDLERVLESAIRDEYNYARSINNSLTSFLVSASKVQENQQRYLNMVKVTDDKIGRVIDQADEVVNSLLKQSEKTGDVKAKITDYTDKAEEYKKKLNALKNDLIK